MLLKKVDIILLGMLLLLPAGKSVAQTVYSVTPSYYFTYGSYSNGATSRSHAGYAGCNIDGRLFPTLAYENLGINTPPWTYRQQMLLGGALYSSFPSTYKFYYGHIKGNFRYKRTPQYDLSIYDYSDYTNFYVAEYVQYLSGWYLGASAVFLNAIGELNRDLKPHQQSQQVTLRLEYIPHYSVLLSLKPSYFRSVTDKRSLPSVAAKVHYLVHDRVLLKAGSMLGRRAYYFDTDLLTISNQDDAQRLHNFIQAEFYPGYDITITGSFLQSKFEGYRINYFVAGIRKMFW